MLIATLNLSTRSDGIPGQAVTIHRRNEETHPTLPYAVVFPGPLPGGVLVHEAATVEEAFTKARAAFERLMLDHMRALREEFEPRQTFATSAEAICDSQNRIRRLAKIGGTPWARRVVYGAQS